MQQVLLIPIGKLGSDALPQCTPLLARLHAQKTSLFAASSNHFEWHGTSSTATTTNTSINSKRINNQSRKHENLVSSTFFLLKDCHLRFPAKSNKELTVFATDNCDFVRNLESLDLCCFSYTDFSYALSHILPPDKIPANWDWLRQVLVSETLCYSYTQLSSKLSSLAQFAQMLKDSKAVALATLSFAPDAIAMLIPTGTEMTKVYRLVDDSRTRAIPQASTFSVSDSDYTTLHCFFLQRRFLQNFEPLSASAQQQVPITTRCYPQSESDSEAPHVLGANQLLKCKLASNPNFLNTLRNRFAQAFGEQHAFMHRHPGSSSRRPRYVTPVTTTVTELDLDQHITQKRLTKKRIVELLKEWTMESACKLQTRFESAGTPIISSLIRGDLLKRAKQSFSRINYEQFVECLNSRGLLSNALRQYIAFLQSQRGDSEGSARKDWPPTSDCMRLSNDSDHLADEDAESVAYPDIPNGSAAASGDSIHTERVVVSNHLVEVLRPNDDGHWVDENAGSKNSLEDAAIDGELILDCEDDDGDIQNGDDTDAEGNEEAYVQSLGAVDDAVMLTNSTTNAQDMDKPEHVESETMLALIREARSSRKFQSPSSVPLSVTDERLRDKLAQEAISVALRTRSRVTLQTLFGILRQHCVRIRGRSLMNSMTKLGYRFDRKLRCYVKS